MCEFLIRVKDKGSDPDPVKDALISKRGHVIACQPDGWGWTKAEQDNPEWVIVKMPGVDPSEYASMIASVNDGTQPLNPTLARRAFSFDLARLPELANVDGQIKNASVQLSRALVDAVKVATPVKLAVDVIG